MEGVRWLLLLAVAAAAASAGVVGAQCLSADDGPGGGAGAEAEVAALRAARADFALALLREAATGPGGAPLVSPASAFDALLLALAGAANRTEDALRATLRLPAHLGKAAALRALRSEALLRAAEAHALALDRPREEEDGEEEEGDGEQAALKPSDAPEREGLRTANRVFVAENVTLRECVKELLGADQESLAVAADPEAAAARVNAWVSEQTAGHIKQLVPALRPDAQLVLVNAAFFRGAWAARFPRNRSALAVFHSAPDRRALVPMMRQKGSFNYVVSERLGAHALELPFARGGFSLLLLLPPFSSAAVPGAAAAEGRSAEGGAGGVELGVDALLRRLDAPALAELLRDLDGAAQTVEVHVPRLALDADIDLVPVLERMGAGDAFQPSADYSGFTGSRGPSFDGARQRARLDADEEGATAAAATALFLFRSARPAEPARFVANHPFALLLLRKQAALAGLPAASDSPPADVLFAGVYRGPTPGPAPAHKQ
ncbi:hypothetical protein R5R35_014427 [Gryllus longicercus]|uniref:Serpin domain-containing protein n=1 Tax=Gryllus longicercus TaxID=2509291 RepID=A0AAN9VSW0_9ORTH